MNFFRLLARRSWILVPVLCLSCALAGCSDDDDSGSSASASGTTTGDGTTIPLAAGDLTGVWDTNMTQPYDDPSWSWDVDVTLTQTGSSVTGTFRAGTDIVTINGTYADGKLTGTDTLGCAWDIDFTENQGNGTRTRWDIPITVVRMVR